MVSQIDDAEAAASDFVAQVMAGHDRQRLRLGARDRRLRESAGAGQQTGQRRVVLRGTAGTAEVGDERVGARLQGVHARLTLGAVSQVSVQLFHLGPGELAQQIGRQLFGIGMRDRFHYQNLCGAPGDHGSDTVAISKIMPRQGNS